jgi:hypothetical protein
MTTIGQIEAEVAQRGGRLAQEYARLKRLGWRLLREPIWFGNASADVESQTLSIDDDEEGMGRIVGWVDEAVRAAFTQLPDVRRSALFDYAAGRFSSRRWRDTDLAIMVDTFEWAAWYFRNEPRRGNDTVAMMNDLTLALAGRTIDLIAESSTYYAFRTGRPQADSTGFKRMLRDGSNQVRHAVFSIQANVRYGEIGFVRAQLREIGASQPADWRLNAACRRVAFALRAILYRWGMQASPHAIGAAVRRELADPRERTPWAGPPGGLPE